MRGLAVVEVQMTADRSAGLADAVVGSEIDLLVFDRAPEPLDENVVPPCSLAVHADGDGLPQKEAGDVGAGDLAAIKGQEAFDPLSGGDAVSRPRRGPY